MDPVKEYIFEYKFDGRTYMLTIPGRDIQQAYSRLNGMGTIPVLKGELIAKIPAGPLGWLHKWWLGK